MAISGPKSAGGRGQEATIKQLPVSDVFRRLFEMKRLERPVSGGIRRSLWACASTNASEALESQVCLVFAAGVKSTAASLRLLPLPPRQATANRPVKYDTCTHRTNTLDG